MNLQHHSNRLIKFVKQHSRVGINVLTGIGVGIAILTLPAKIFGHAWLVPLLDFLVKIGSIIGFLLLALLATAAAQWLPGLRSSMYAYKLARSAANRVCRLSLNAAALLAGLGCVAALSHNGHASWVMLKVAIWFIALRQLIREHASGSPRTNIANACTGWMAAVSFQSNITHFVAMALHHI